MKIFSLNIGPFCFSPSIIPLMAALFFAAIFAGLGRWQIDRMMEKQLIEEQYSERQNAPAETLPRQIDDIEAWRFRNVRVRGAMSSDKQFLLDNQVRNKQAGYSVLTPLMTEDGRVILIDRGWVPLVDGMRERLPRADLPSAAEREHTIEGRFYAPFGDMVTLGDPQMQTRRWPIVIQTIDFAMLRGLLDAPVAPFVVRMSPSLPHGYLREWPQIAFSSAKHLGYAVQWFALSLVCLILLIALNTTRKQ